MHYSVVAFKTIKATGMSVSGKIQYICIDRNRKMLLIIDALQSTLTITHQDISIIQEMPVL